MSALRQKSKVGFGRQGAFKVSRRFASVIDDRLLAEMVYPLDMGSQTKLR